MRWIDIILPEPGINRTVDDLLEQAARSAEEMPAIQERDGLDALSVIQAMAETGRLLFQAVTAASPDAFDPDANDRGCRTPPLEIEIHDDLVGYHLVTDPGWAGLPWSWLHNSLGFLLEKHPLTVGTTPSSLPPNPVMRPWMQRLRRSEFLVGPDGGSGLRAILPQMRPPESRPPELLFIPGHTEPQRRRLIYREAEAMEASLTHSLTGAELIRMDVPLEAVTPSRLCEQGYIYQVLHFAGPTSHAGRSDDTAGEAWMDELIAEAPSSADDIVEQAVGLEGEVLGVDPITSLLDDISDRYDREGLREESLPLVSRQAGGGGAANESRTSPSRAWLLDDGPVGPESLDRGGQVPPFVFSNSYRSLPDLGQRFTTCGASLFIGPLAPLFSRPARIFVGYFYRAMGEGWCAGAALWRAARDSREELGSDHPAWLSYGAQGYGSLALQYL